MLEPRRVRPRIRNGVQRCALLLAALGVYGVMSYAVTQRTHEMGIRMALGATAHDVLIAVLVRGLGLAVVGSLVAVDGAVAFSRVLADQLYETSPVDPMVFVITSLLLLAVGALATYLPGISCHSRGPRWLPSGMNEGGVWRRGAIHCAIRMACLSLALARWPATRH